ncbi:MAG: PAS domain S-box protein [Frankiaceae bacterium]|nr:PAS domain S-box protein [Frankiaceae bacterium]
MTHPLAEAHRSRAVRTRLYVATVVALAAVVSTWAALAVPGTDAIAPGYLVVFVALIALGECLQIRYFHRQDIAANNLIEAMFAPLIFRGSGLEVVIAVGCGLLVASAVRRNGVLKSVFNIAQWVASACVGLLAFHASGAGLGSSTSDVVALVGAMLAVWLTNQMFMGGVLWCVTGHPLGSGDHGMLWMVLLGRLGGFAGSTVLGLLTTAAYVWVPWTGALAAGPMVFLWSAGRAQASIHADRRLLDGLQRATHHLATSLDPAIALAPSLATARAGFEVREVQLVLVAERGFPTTYSCLDGPDGYSVTTAPHGLAELLVDTLIAPARLGSSGGDVAAALGRMGYQRGLAAPLRSGGQTFGVLLLLDREGAEGFEAGELAVAGAFARELVGFLERVELVGAIEEERRKLNDIVQHTGDGIVSIDAEGTILSWNTAMEAITGYSADEMIDTRHFGLLRPRDAHDVDLHVGGWSERYAAGGLASEMQIVTADGATVWLSCSYSQVPAKDDGVESLIIVARNITQARELEVLKDDFIAVVSHELRTPLVPIKGWAQTLLNRGDRLSDDQRRTAVQSILTQAQRLEALVLNILESSRVEAGQSEALDLVDVAAVAVHVVEDVLAARPDRVIRVRPPQVPCPVRGSTVWVDRALANLVANAVKYSPDDSPVDVVVSCEAGLVNVSVTDRGPGISEEAQERIFERFERLEESRKQTGTGLGLYITRRLARAMGGDVTVSSLPGAGSTFVLTLPASVDAAASTATPPVTAPAQRAPEDSSGKVVRLY